MKRGWAAAVGLVVMGGLGLWLWNDDARRIDRQLSGFVDLVGKSPVETQFQGARKANAIADLFASKFELIAEPENYVTSNRQDLVRAVMAYRSRSTTLTVDLVRKELVVDPARTSATYFLYVRFVTDLRGLVEAATFPVRIEWVDQEGAWLVKKLEVLAEE